MNFKDWCDKRMHNLTLFDFGLIKLALVLFGIIIGAYASAAVLTYIWVFVILFVVSYAVAALRILRN